MKRYVDLIRKHFKRCFSMKVNVNVTCVNVACVNITCVVEWKTRVKNVPEDSGNSQ